MIVHKNSLLSLLVNEVVFVAYLCLADWLAYPYSNKLDTAHNLYKFI